MTVKTRKKSEYGDFQTPTRLAAEVCCLLAKQGLKPASVVEPTCGLGRFLFAGLDAFSSVKIAIGADINSEYIERAKATLRQRCDAQKVELAEADFFVTDWARILAKLPEPILIIGNLPWVTNARLQTLGSVNLPAKSNFQNRSGLDAITGKANFDISEWMLIRLIEAVNGRCGSLAMLCKAAVARKTLYHAWKHGIALEKSVLYRIDAALHFDAAVDAGLLVTHFRPGAHDLEAEVYPWLATHQRPATLGYEDDVLVADITAYRKWKHLGGEDRSTWRSGIKHDCSKVMELRQKDTVYWNGLGELVELEDAFVYPMLKSSDVARGRRIQPRRWMIVTQRTVGQDTAAIQTAAPKTWAYLEAHADLLHKRGSSIYRHRPPFSIFGIGEYSFAPWKVAISGFYKKLAFVVVGPYGGKPVVLDDTSYFLPCQSKEHAEYMGGLLNSSIAQAFYGAFVFWDAKRPITADVLRRLDLRLLAKELGSEAEFDGYVRERGIVQHKPIGRKRAEALPGLWAET